MIEKFKVKPMLTTETRSCFSVMLNPRLRQWLRIQVVLSGTNMNEVTKQVVEFAMKNSEYQLPEDANTDAFAISHGNNRLSEEVRTTVQKKPAKRKKKG